MSPEDAADTIREKAAAYGEAKAQRVYLEEFKSSKRALLMKDSLLLGEKAVNAQEREAYSDPEYVQLLKGLKEAVESEEEIRWGLVAAQARIEVWRSMEATNRAEGKATI